MKTILITLLALGFGISSVLADTSNLGRTQLAEQSSTFKPKNQPGPNQKIKAPSSGPSRSISNGGCCAKVNNQCVTICSKPGGCTGVGDCITNPN